MSKRLQEDWARAAEEGLRVLMNLRTHLFLEVASPPSLPSLFRCHSCSKKQKNSLMKKILGLQAPMELTSPISKLLSCSFKENPPVFSNSFFSSIFINLSIALFCDAIKASTLLFF
ncbi:hypothetical protein HKD37_05G012529 [Glycine soja]